MPQSTIHVVILSLLLPFAVAAQEKGVHFEHALSWTEVKAKAKAENKYIFVDCFTTWCGPCKYMSTVIFPQEESGVFFNDKFVNVEVQLDTTAKDNDRVKSWYADAHAIMTQYSINAFPTYLIFAPDGRVLHRIVGGSNSAKMFINVVQEAFDTTKQYYTKLEQFEKGRRDSAFLCQLALQAHKAYDMPTGKKVAKVFLASQPNLFTPAALNLINTYTTQSTDEYFGFLAEHASEINQVIGAGKAEKKIRTIFLNEGNRLAWDKNLVPDWKRVQKKIAARLPSEADEITMRIKINYYNTKRDWPKFEKAIVSYMKQYSHLMNDGDLNSLAWNVFEHCSDMTCVSQILDWSKQLKNAKDPAFLDTYANLLYKLGKTDDAIALEQKAHDLSPANERSGFQSTIDKMKKGEKTWN
ncbi:MAG TPA: thioredoxin fold domain-containing protein [Niastella sp.]